MKKPAIENWYIFALGSFLFAHMVDFMIIMPLGPTFITNLLIDSQQFSWLVSSYTLTAAISGVFGLLWMDRFDRKKALLVVVCCFSLATALCGLANSYHMLLIARMATGIFGGLINAQCLTIISELVPFERRGFAMGKMMMAFSLGSIVGIPSGLMLANTFGWRAPFMAIALFGVLMIILAWYILPPIDAHLKAVPEAINWAEIREIIAEPSHVSCFLFMAALMFSQFCVVPFIGTVLVQNLGVDQAHLPWVYLLGGSATAITGPIIGKLADTYSKPLLFKICALLVMIPIAAITTIQQASLFLILLITTAFFIFMSGRMSPAMALISAQVDARQRGRFLGFNAAVQQAAAGLGSAVAGALVVLGSDGRMHHFSWVGGIAIASGLLSILLVNKLKLSIVPKIEEKKSLEKIA